MNGLFATPPIESFSSREIEIINLLAEGCSNQEVCNRLHLSMNTVRWYLRHIYDKLGFDAGIAQSDKRQFAVSHARQVGLIGYESSPIKHNLPARTTTFIGRNRELSELRALLAEPEARLVTVLAPGGMGKTRLALEVARKTLTPNPSPSEREIGFPSGVYFVPLQALSDPANIVPAIAEHTGYQFQQDGREAKQQILDYLSNKKWLLVLDNFEHLLEGAGLVADILQAAPEVKGLVTSRERLKLRPERVYTIHGMPVSEAEHDAVRLFMESAKGASHEIELDEDDWEWVIRICQLVEGMPLAIILAAAWVNVLSLEEIAEEISRSVDFLSAEMPDMPRRQWSIRAVFEPTWRRLTEEEQAVFMKFAVFRGGCTREAAQAVTGATLHNLQSLVNKALVTRTPEGRYMIHELLRQYAEAKLDESGEAKGIHEDHCKYYTAAMKKYEADFDTKRELVTLDEIENDFENVRAAWIWAVHEHRIEPLELAHRSLLRFFHSRNRDQDGRTMYEMALQAIAADSASRQLYGKLLLNYSEFLPSPDASVAAVEQALVIAREGDDRDELAFSLLLLTDLYSRLPDKVNEAWQLVDEVLTLYRTIGNRRFIGWAFLNKAFLAALGGDLEAALGYSQSALEIFQELGSQTGIAHALSEIASAWLLVGDIAESEHLHSEALGIFREIGFLQGIAWSLNNLSVDVAWRGDFGTARSHSNEALSIYKQLNLLPDIGETMALVSAIDVWEGHYDAALERCEQAPKTFHVQGEIFLLMASGLCLCGLEDYSTARSKLRQALIQINRPRHTMTVARETMWWKVVMGLSIVLAHEGQLQRTVEVMSVALNTPWTIRGIEKTPLVSKWFTDVQGQMPLEEFEAAWERGKTLDLETVVRALLEEYGETSP